MAQGKVSAASVLQQPRERPLEQKGQDARIASPCWIRSLSGFTHSSESAAVYPLKVYHASLNSNLEQAPVQLAAARAGGPVLLTQLPSCCDRVECTLSTADTKHFTHRAENPVNSVSVEQLTRKVAKVIGVGNEVNASCDISGTNCMPEWTVARKLQTCMLPSGEKVVELEYDGKVRWMNVEKTDELNRLQPPFSRTESLLEPERKAAIEDEIAKLKVRQTMAAEREEFEEAAAIKRVIKCLQEALDVATQPKLPSTSLGSARHLAGKCRPCAFFSKPEGCDNGVNCSFCHLCDLGEKKRRRKERFQQRNARRAQAQK